MLTVNYRYRIYPNTAQEQILNEWMDICRGAYNYARGEIKDWCDSRKCLVDRCSLEKEYILSGELKFPNEIQQLNNLPKAKKEFPRLGEVPSQVLQQAIKQLHVAWKYFQERGFGFPRFKKYGQLKSLLFPQFKENPVTNLNIKLPKLGKIPINLHRPIPAGFAVKQVRILRKADRWYASICLQCDVSIPDPTPHGHPVGVDIGLEKFLATSDGAIVKPPKFFKSLQGRLKVLQRRLSRKQKRSKNYEKHRTDRDVAAGQNIRNRGIVLISTVGQTGKETACADDLPGTGETLV
ncbi:MULTISPECIES: RNA-guided endonuclease InsQ/TnpB family protein [Aerosakkonema]|uniref:RNA-guided endonuclease InsQ/TnpB family protein n=1 Tax=Aerosakkonema TaxID=1246629 RepID=UPI0035B6C14A